MKFIAEPLRNPDIMDSSNRWNKPYNVGALMQSFQTAPPAALEELLASEFHPASEVRVSHIATTRFTNDFRATSDDAQAVVRIAREVGSPNRVLARDAHNLARVRDYSQGLTPRLLAQTDNFEVDGFGTVPALATESFRDYAGVYYTDGFMGNQGYFYINDPKKQFLKEDESKAAMVLVAAIPSTVFFRSYYANASSGLLLHNLHIDSDDFVYYLGKGSVKQPVKLWTLRGVDPATPNQFLFHVLSPNSIDDEVNLRGYDLSRSWDYNDSRLALDGVKRSLHDLSADEGARLFEERARDFIANAPQEVGAIAASIENGSLTDISDLPAGYRTFVQLQSIVTHHEVTQGRVSIGMKDANSYLVAHREDIAKKLMDLIDSHVANVAAYMRS